MAEGGAAGGARYTAFVSYSHKDAAHARWLHRKLETYRIPRRLVGSEGEHGPVPPRLTPIFRDRDELPAAGDLTEKVRAALAASDNLIVICSPHAAASPWVAREIEVFRGLHPDRPVFCAIVAGDPHECFPPPLRGTTKDGRAREPLAADLRPDRDGRRLGLLKLVAGLAGVGLDALVQRDSARRVRRVTAITAGALVAMLAMAVLTTLALSARAEAERQRAEAEGLIEFMLTDLRDKLKGVGRLDVMAAVNQRALGHYARHDLSRLSDDQLQRRARILHAMGEDDEKRGDLPRALAQFREAARTTAALLANDPDNVDRIYGHAQSEFWVGLIAWRSQQFAAAHRAFSRYRGLAGQLVAADPRNPDWLMEAGYADSNLGTLLLRERNRAAEARRKFLASLESFEAAARLRPDDPDIIWEIQDAHAWIADSYRTERRHSQAMAHRKRQAELLGQLVRLDPKNVRYQRGLIGNAIGTGQIEIDSGRPASALTRLESTYRDAGRLAREDPENEDLAKQRTAAGLFAAKALMAAAPPPWDRQRIDRFLNGCAARFETPDPEIDAFCDILRRRAARQSAAVIRAASRTMIGPADRQRLSPRWGIDFEAERSAHP